MCEFWQKCRSTNWVCSQCLVGLPSGYPLRVWAVVRRKHVASGWVVGNGSIIPSSLPSPPHPQARGHSTLPRGAGARVWSPHAGQWLSLCHPNMHLCGGLSRGYRMKSHVLTQTTSWRRNLQASTKFTGTFSLWPAGHWSILNLNHKHMQPWICNSSLSSSKSQSRIRVK